MSHEALMHDVNRDARYIGTKYSVQIGPLYFEWDKFIPTLEKHFPDILDEILNCDHQRDALIQNQPTLVKLQSQLLIQPVAPGMGHTLPQLNQKVYHAITMVLPIGKPYSHVNNEKHSPSVLPFVHWAMLLCGIK